VEEFAARVREAERRGAWARMKRWLGRGR
jgi:hypothetical protein